MDRTHDLGVPPVARRAFILLGVVVIAGGALGMSAKGAYNQCEGKWLDSSTAGSLDSVRTAIDVDPSWWPPGARCTLTSETGEVRTYHLPWD